MSKTKIDLMAENEQLTKRVEELTAALRDGGGGGDDPAPSMVQDSEGNDLVNGQHYEYSEDFGLLLVEASSEGEPRETDHALMRQIEMLKADKQMLTVQRDEARDAARRAGVVPHSARVDDLPRVV